VSSGDFEKIILSGKRLSPELYDLKLKLEKYKADAQRIVNDLGTDFTFEKFSDLFFGKKQVLSRQAKFSDIVHEYLAIKPLSINTKNGYRTTLSHISEIFPKLTIGDLSTSTINDLRSHLKNRASISTITVYLRYMKAVWNFSASNGWVNKDNSPFTGVKLPSTLKRKRALVKEQLRMIKDYATNDALTQRAIDFFFISYYSNGINFKDLLHLKSTNIKDGYIEFFRAKTRNSVARSQQTIQVSIEPQLQALLDKWAKIDLTKDDYIFPFIDDTMSESRRQRVVDQFIQNTNKHLDIVGKKLDLPLKLTTYVARHSFASRIALSSLNPFVVKELLGHATVQQSETYISTLDTSVSRIAAKLVADI
jgi:integrase